MNNDKDHTDRQTIQADTRYMSGVHPPMKKKENDTETGSVPHQGKAQVFHINNEKDHTDRRTIQADIRGKVTISNFYSK